MTRDKEGVNVVVSTHWVAANLDDSQIRVVECHGDLLAQSQGHIPGAFSLDVRNELSDNIVRDVIDAQEFERMCERLGITSDTLVVFSGDKSNLWSCHAYWVFQLFGHTRAAVMDGGRSKWVSEGRPLAQNRMRAQGADYGRVVRDDRTNRAFREDVLLHVVDKGITLDARSPEEFQGSRSAVNQYPEECFARGGHVLGAVNLPWTLLTRSRDKTFRPLADLAHVVESSVGSDTNNDVITYCGLGERSSLVWFVMKKLLGWNNVRNYDGGWLEWGNAVGLPIER